MAVITEYESEILYGLQMDVDWDRFTQNQARTINERQKEALIYWAKLVETNYEFIANGILGKVNPLLYLGSIAANSVEFLFVKDPELKHTLSVIEFSTALAAGALKWTGPWGVFFTLLLNYDDYRDWVADEVYNFMMLVDKLTPKVEEGTGALLRIAINSYEQTLPAKHSEGNVTFTLSTNVTYTQMGANVKEWGVALFKGNELIGKYPVANISEKTQFIDFSFDITKKQFNLDYDDYIATPKDEWCLKAYEINTQNPNIPIFGRSKTVLELVYDQKPSITMKDLEVGETVGINEDNRDRQIFYKYKWVTTGTLFMEEYREYWKGNWTNSGKGDPIALYDGTWWYSEPWVKFSSKRKAGTDYMYYVGKVDGKEIRSTNYLKYDFEGRNCTISLVDGTVDSRSRSVNEVQNINGLVVNGLPVRLE